MGTPVAELIRTWRAAASDGVYLPVVTGADMVDNEADLTAAGARPGLARGFLGFSKASEGPIFGARCGLAVSRPSGLGYVLRDAP
jgi:hypothetical protein